MHTATELSQDNTEFTFDIGGMTCASCVDRVERALKAVAGVETASINLVTEGATVRTGSNTTVMSLYDAVHNAGFEVPTKNIVLLISGMTCASCSGCVEKALQKVLGVTNVAVNLATEKAHVEASSIVTSDVLVAAVSKAGYEGSLATDTRSVEGKGDSLPSWWPVALSGLLSLPLILPMLALPFGRDWSLPG